MNIPKIAVELGKIDPKYLDEAADYKPKKPHMRIKTVLIAAAIAVLALGTTAAASNSFFGLRQIFGYLSNSGRGGGSPDLPEITDSGIYGTESAAEDTENGLTVRLTSVACGEHYLAAVVEADASALGEIPEGILPTFRSYGDSLVSGSYIATLLSREGSVYTFGYVHTGFKNPPTGGFTVELSGFGYYPDPVGSPESFVYLERDAVSLTVPAESLNVLPSVAAREAKTVCGLEMKMELSPFGILLTYDYSKAVELGYSEDKYFIDLSSIRLIMRDGTTFGDGEDYSSVSGLIASQNGWIDPENGRDFHDYIGFSVPLDLSKIEAVEFKGEIFEFDTEDYDD